MVTKEHLYFVICRGKDNESEIKGLITCKTSNVEENKRYFQQKFPDCVVEVY